MRQATIKFTDCMTCPYEDRDDSGDNFCGITDGFEEKYKAQSENRDGITPSCPMYSNSVEVEG